MRIRQMCAFGVVLACAAVPALGHHSGAMFDRTKIVTLKGTIKAYEFTNPHTWIRLVVLDSGHEQIEWDIEGAAPYRMSDWHITPQTVRAGDKVSLRMHPLKDGRHGGILIDITFPDGRVLSTPSRQD